MSRSIMRKPRFKDPIDRLLCDREMEPMARLQAFIRAAYNFSDKPPHRSRLRPRHRSIWYEILKNDPCCYCGRESNTIEHPIPFSICKIGGWRNSVGACKNCNQRRGAMGLLRFILYRQFKNQYTTKRQAKEMRLFP